MLHARRCAHALRTAAAQLPRLNCHGSTRGPLLVRPPRRAPRRRRAARCQRRGQQQQQQQRRCRVARRRRGPRQGRLRTRERRSRARRRRRGALQLGWLPSVSSAKRPLPKVLGQSGGQSTPCTLTDTIVVHLVCQPLAAAFRRTAGSVRDIASAKSARRLQPALFSLPPVSLATVRS